MILPEAEAVEKICGQSMGQQNPPRKCLGGGCMWWVQVAVLYGKAGLAPVARGTCGMIRRQA